MKLTVDFRNVKYPIVGAWKRSRDLTRQSECGNEWSDASTGEGPFRCGRKVWIDPEWLRAYERFWPIQRPGILCPNCAETTGLAEAIRGLPASDLGTS